jgi:hypothetical protein
MAMGKDKMSRHSDGGFVVRRQGKGESVRVGGFVVWSGSNEGMR